MVRAGLSDKDICSTLKVTAMTLRNWENRRPELKEAEEIARKERSENESLPNFIYTRLSPKMKELWDKIKKLEKSANGAAKIELLLQDHGKNVRQQLFLHALCMGGFSASMALAKVNVTKKELDNWINTDLEFAELVEEINWHKGNFFEESLVKLVQQGNTAAVLFANKSFNDKRGYGNKSQVDVNVSGQVMHGVLDLSELMPFLSAEAKTELLEAIRRKDEQANARTNTQQQTAIESLNREIATIPEAEIIS